MLALSLDLILGYAGILSLGHAAFFGTGAYTAGLLARHGWTEPLSGLAAAALVSAGLGYLVSALVVRGADLSRLMATLRIGLLMFEAANQASSITGGVEGLADMQPGRLFGRFAFGLDGTTACVYSFAVLVVMFALARRVVHSPFGLSLRGIRENVLRMPAIGTNVHGRLRAIFALAAGIVGVAGAVLAQTTQFVGIDTLNFQGSAELLIMLVLGGAGRLYGGLLGATVTILAQDYLAKRSPERWQFWLGAMLAALVLLARELEMQVESGDNAGFSDTVDYSLDRVGEAVRHHRHDRGSERRLFGTRQSGRVFAVRRAPARSRQKQESHSHQ